MTNSALRPGDRLGAFRIVGQLGAGGMGEVYRAHDERLKREVALKVLPAQVRADATARARLLREARSAAALSHPNICTVFDVGEDQGRDFIAMELVEGHRLDERSRPAGMAVSDVVRLGGEIADALSHAHDHRVIHRDLKTANVMVGARGHVKVMDFGLARRVVTVDASTLGQAEATLTEAGAIVGTPHYLPPEALHGAEVDERGDIWALGVMLHEMASGGMPFEGTTQYEVAGAIMHTVPRALPDDVPAGLRAVIARCLEKEPAQRYQHAGEVREALEAVALASTPQSQSAPMPAASSASGGSAGWARHLRRAPPARVLGSVLGLLLMVVLFMNRDRVARLLRGAPIGAPISALAVLPLENLSRDPEQAYFADGMTEEISTRLSQISALRVLAQGSVSGLVEKHKSPNDIGRALRVSVLLRGSVIRADNRVRISVQLVEAASGYVRWSNSYERRLVDVLALQSEVALAIAQEIQVRLTPQEHTRLAASKPIDPEAYEAYLKGRAAWSKYTLEAFRESERQFKRALDIAPQYAPAWAGLADAAYGMSSLFIPANEAIPKARAAAEKAIELDSTLSEAHTSIGIVKLVYDWDLTGAEWEFDRSIELNPGDANAHLWRGHLLVLVGRFDDGLAAIRKAHDLDPLSSLISMNLGWHLYFARRYDEALRQLRLVEASDPENHEVWFVLGLVLEHLGDYTGAIEEFEKKDKLSPNNDNLS